MKTEDQCSMEIIELNIAYCEKRAAEYCNLAFSTKNRNYFLKAGCYIDLLRQKSIELEQLQKRETRIFGRQSNDTKRF